MNSEEYIRKADNFLGSMPSEHDFTNRDLMVAQTFATLALVETPKEGLSAINTNLQVIRKTLRKECL